MAQPWYATREQVKQALDLAESARPNAQIDRALQAATRSIDALCHRHFYPFDATRYLGFRTFQEGGSSWRRWLSGDEEIVSLSTLAVGGTTISASDYFLEPANVGPPYTSLQVDLGSNAAFAAGDTWQRAFALTGIFGYWDEHESVGTLSSDLDADLTDTANITWTDPTKIGVGSILKVDSERLIITERSFVDSTQNLGGSGLAASVADVTVPISSAAGFYVGETIRIDAERMLVVDISGTNLIVKRAWDGSVLAAHSATADVYGLTGIEIARAQLGSVLAAHTSSDVVYRYVPPPLVQELAIAEALVMLQQEQAGYAYRSRSGEAESGGFGAGIPALRSQVRAAYGRKSRTAAV